MFYMHDYLHADIMFDIYGFIMCGFIMCLDKLQVSCYF